MSTQTVSKHVHMLQEAGLVSRSVDAQRRPCHLEAAALERMAAWIDTYRLHAEQRFRALDAVLAELAPATPSEQEDQT